MFTAPGATFPFGTHVAVVEVDTETGKVVLRRVVTVDDAGLRAQPAAGRGPAARRASPRARRRRFLEEVVYDADGNPLTASFADYPILSATEVPSFELADMETPTSYNPLGVKGIGEAGTIGATPAVQNAVVDARRPPRRQAHRHAGHAACGSGARSAGKAAAEREQDRRRA